MRNLSQYPITVYPITVAEIIEYLEELGAEKALDAAPGDMGPLLLEAAAKLVSAAGYVVDIHESINPETEAPKCGLRIVSSHHDIIYYACDCGHKTSTIGNGGPYCRTGFLAE